jgi:hypothetical protein
MLRIALNKMECDTVGMEHVDHRRHQGIQETLPVLAAVDRIYGIQNIPIIFV